MKAMFIKTDDTVELIDIELGEGHPHDKLYDFIVEKLDGYVEHVYLLKKVSDSQTGEVRKTPFASMYINEEGKNLSLPINKIATQLHGSYDNRFDWIAGDALIFGLEDSHGNDTSVTPDTLEAVALAAYRAIF